MKEKGCANLDWNENGNGYLAGENVGVNECLNVSEDGILRLGNESVTD